MKFKKYFWLFLLNPFIALVFAMQSLKFREVYNWIWAFTIFYGCTFAIGQENSNSDIVRYLDEYKSLYGQQFTLGQAFDYFINSGEIDILRTVLAVGLSRITDAQLALTAT